MRAAHSSEKLVSIGWALALAALVACSRDEAPGNAKAPADRPSILLVTLDTTRADAVGDASHRVETPNLDALAARGLRFDQAYTVAPQTLTAHTSMLTGLYPSEHGVRENGRYLAADRPLLPELLAAAGYRTAAFVSGFPLTRAFGLARGFAVYDDDLGPRGIERPAPATTDRALAYLKTSGEGPLFLWVHYYDAHDPYEPPEPFRSRYRADPYLGEIAAVDQQLGRLLAGFRARVGRGPWQAIVVGDHGEGRGDHGEQFHGHLLYQGAMRVPLAIAGSGISPGVREEPVSTRRVYDTVLAWAGRKAPWSLLDARPEVVLGEAMMPFVD
ncbi:MAG TPA: sulfatase, partial [Thermoanaerobaculia bacterium]|nr:sulfatase [Thermoanaerobaculia bacterium]